MIFDKLNKQFYLLVLLLIFIIIGIIAFLIINKEPSIQSYSSKLSEMCSDRNDWRECYGKDLANKTKTTTLSYSLSVLNEIKHLDPKTQECHLISHYIATAAVTKNPTSWKEIIKDTYISDCTYGFIHGILEGLAHIDPSFKITPTNITKMCGEIGKIKKTLNIEQACAHAMGHILITNYCSQNVTKSIKNAASACGNLSTKLQNECYAGVFMESFTRDNLNTHCNVPHMSVTEKSIKQQEDICNSYSENAGRACWQEISYMYSEFQPISPSIQYNLCARAPDQASIAYCYLNSASHVLPFVNNPSQNYLRSICDQISDDYWHKVCIKNVVISLIYSSSTLNNLTVKFCNSQLREDLNLCFNAFVETIKTKENYQDKSICSSLPSEFREKCLN